MADTAAAGVACNRDHFRLRQPACGHPGKFARQRTIAVGLLVLAIVGLHFTGMAALKITPLMFEVTATNDEATATLALAIVGMTMLIVGTGVVSHLIDQGARAIRTSAYAPWRCTTG